MIELTNVNYKIAGSQIIDDVSLAIPKGQMTALIGANGAGKSSLLSLMSRLTPVQSGRITCDGADITEMNSSDLARKLSILRQTNDISSRLSVRDLVSFGRYPYHKGRPTPHDWEQVEQAISLFEMTNLEHRFLDELSGGQRQRALVAMSYCQGTDYLLLDEPLNSLDLYHARKLMQTLRHLTQTDNRTVVIVLHDINYAGAYADNIIALKAGRLSAHGPTSEVLNNQSLWEIFGTSIDVQNIGGRAVALHH